MEGFVDQLGIKGYNLYLMDCGAPIGFRLAAKHPERVQSLIVQNGNAYDEIELKHSHEEIVGESTAIKSLTSSSRGHRPPPAPERRQRRSSTADHP